MTMINNMKAYDWATWVMGIWRSVIGGGAGAVAGSFGPMVTDPKDWNIHQGLGNVFESMAIGFVIGALVHLFIFLSTHPAPDPVPQTQEVPK